MKSTKSGLISLSHDKKCQKQESSDRRVRCSYPYKSLRAYARVSVYTSRKKLGVAMHLYTGETIDGWAY